MDQQKQIEEMTLDICPRITTCEDCEDDIKSDCPYTTLAKNMVEQGYQKIDKCMMLISEEEYLRLNQTVTPKKIRKDAVKEVLTTLRNGVDLNSMIDGEAKTAVMNELRWAAQHYGVEVK